MRCGAARTVMLGTAAVVAMAGSAAAQDMNRGMMTAPPGPYFSVAGGWNWLEDIDEPVPTLPVTALDMSFEDDWAAAGAFGFNFDPYRLELELAYRTNDLESFALDGVPFAGPTGEVETYALMLNAVWDLPVSRWAFLTLGGGIGWADTEISGVAGGGTFVGGDDQHFVYQGIAGLTFPVWQRAHLFVDYRYFGEVGAEFAALGTRLEPDLTSHTVLAGVRVFLGTPPAPAPEPAPVAPAPEPVAEVREFVVFFDFDRANLTADARTVVAEAAQAIQSGQNVRVTVTGHTDTVGSQAYNQRLSERRAQAVKAELVNRGVAEGEITTIGRSFNEPAVQTGPGVREPRNRRAVIDF